MFLSLGIQTLKKIDLSAKLGAQYNAIKIRIHPFYVSLIQCGTTVF